MSVGSKTEWKQTDGQTDGRYTDCFIFPANAVSQNWPNAEI